MKVRLVANWQVNDCPSMVIELPCLPPVGSLINLDVDYEDEVFEDNKMKKKCEDFIDNVEEITGSGSSLFVVEDIWFHASNNIPTIYVEQDYYKCK